MENDDELLPGSSPSLACNDEEAKSAPSGRKERHRMSSATDSALDHREAMTIAPNKRCACSLLGVSLAS